MSSISTFKLNRQDLVRFYVEHIRDRAFVASCITSIIILALSVWVSYYAGIYATASASNSVTDIILSNIPVFNVDIFFIYGAYLMWVIIGIILLCMPKRIPFTLKSVSMFIVVRSVFVSLTHIGLFPGHTVIDVTGLMGIFTSAGDLFFSGHTGLPFLFALIFWDMKPLRWTFILASVFFGVIVLLGHIHYTIDVTAAYFITYGIYRLSQILFGRDFVMMGRSLPQAP